MFFALTATSIYQSLVYRHRSAFYDECNKNWSKTLRTNSTSEEDEVSGSESSQSNNAADKKGSVLHCICISIHSLLHGFLCTCIFTCIKEERST